MFPTGSRVISTSWRARSAPPSLPARTLRSRLSRDVSRSYSYVSVTPFPSRAQGLAGRRVRLDRRHARSVALADEPAAHVPGRGVRCGGVVAILVGLDQVVHAERAVDVERRDAAEQVVRRPVVDPAAVPGVDRVAERVGKGQDIARVDAALAEHA